MVAFFLCWPLCLPAGLFASWMCWVGAAPPGRAAAASVTTVQQQQQRPLPATTRWQRRCCCDRCCVSVGQCLMLVCFLVGLLLALQGRQLRAGGAELFKRLLAMVAGRHRSPDSHPNTTTS